ncbi:MAG: hypothetical protein EXQ56_00845 [Acidobacteria bacterium]|nr:hypothetical protein [Acidobacteriota bacterium]
MRRRTDRNSESNLQRARRCIHLCALAVLSFLLAPAGWAQTASQTSEALFDDSVVHEIHLTMAPADWAQLKANFRADTYYQANFSWSGQQVQRIGVRSRGNGSASGEKPYLGLDFSRYVSSQRFLGLSAFRLKNALQDWSFVHDRLSMALFRRMNIPAPREAFAKVFMNGDYIGLYIIIEEMDTNFLNRVYGESAGYLFQFSWVREYNFEFLGNDPANYAPNMFEPKTRKTSYDPATLVAMIRAINQSSDANFIAAVSEYIDLKEWLQYLAVEQYLAEFDGVFGHLGMNNFYLYRPPNGKLFHITPWDKEQGFWEPEKSIWARTQQNVLMRRAMQVPALRDLYLDAVRRAALAAGGPGGWLEKELARAYEQIREAALSDPAKLTTNEEFEFAIEVTRQFIQVRRDNVISEAGPIPAPSVRSAIPAGMENPASPELVVGGLAAIEGENLAYWDWPAAEFPLPRQLNTSVAEVNGIAVAPGHINFQVPWEMAGLTSATLRVVVDGKPSNVIEIPLTDAAPRLISASLAAPAIQPATADSSNGDSDGSGTNPNAMARGSVISIYAIGLGPVANQPTSGDRPSADLPAFSLHVPEVTIGDVPAQVLYSGLAPEWVGVYQINVAVPMDAPGGDSVPLMLRMGSVESNLLHIPIQ